MTAATAAADPYQKRFKMNGTPKFHRIFQEAIAECFTALLIAGEESEPAEAETVITALVQG